MTERVRGLYTGEPDPRNSQPLEQLDGYTVGQAVDVPSRTIGPCHIETLFQRANTGAVLSMARVINKEGKRLDVLTGELKP